MASLSGKVQVTRLNSNAERIRLVFVYNADSGVFNTLSDIAHKIFSPGTYTCNLCRLTHGYFSERKAWREFLNGLDAELQFLHRDEFLAKTGGAFHDFPAIFTEEQGQYRPWMGSEQLGQLDTVEALMDAIRQRLEVH